VGYLTLEQARLEARQEWIADGSTLLLPPCEGGRSNQIWMRPLYLSIDSRQRFRWIAWVDRAVEGSRMVHYVHLLLLGFLHFALSTTPFFAVLLEEDDRG